MSTKKDAAVLKLHELGYEWLDGKWVSNPQAQVVATRQYYYRVNGCPANGSRNDNCICWHDEGTGPCKDGRPAHPDVPLTWRQKGGV